MGSELDIDNIEEIFNMDSLTTENSNKEIVAMRDKLEVLEEMEELESDQIIRMNIARANNLLDWVEEDYRRGSTMDARKMEACAKLIAEITNAANSLAATDLQTQTIDIRERTLNLKEFEVKAKVERQNNKNDNTTINNNVVVTSRDDLFKMLKNEQKEKEEEKIIDV